MYITITSSWQVSMMIHQNLTIQERKYWSPLSSANPHSRMKSIEVTNFSWNIYEPSVPSIKFQEHAEPCFYKTWRFLECWSHMMNRWIGSPEQNRSLCWLRLNCDSASLSIQRTQQRYGMDQPIWVVPAWAVLVPSAIGLTKWIFWKWEPLSSTTLKSMPNGGSQPKGLNQLLNGTLPNTAWPWGIVAASSRCAMHKRLRDVSF